MSRQTRNAVIISALIWAWAQPPAWGGTISVTFDESQLVNNDPLLQFYNGGLTYRGIGPGPNLGVTFTMNARGFTNTSSLTGTFTQPGIMELYSDTAREGEGISATMDIAPGFTGKLLFDYAAIDAGGSLSIYDGLNGTGNVLASVDLPVTSPQTGPGVFVPDVAAFSGVAHSVVFNGGNKQLAFDDLTINSLAPEPPAFCLLLAGAVLLAAARRVFAAAAGSRAGSRVAREGSRSA